MNRYKIAAGMLILPLVAAGCGQQEQKEYENTVICSDFVSYDITRRIAEGADISVGGIDFSNIDWERGISGRDKNRINNSMLFVNGTWIDEELGEVESGHKIMLADFGARKKNDKEKNMLYSGISIKKETDTDDKKENSTGNKQVVVNPGAVTAKPDIEKEENPSSGTSPDSQTDKNRDTENTENTDSIKNNGTGGTENSEAAGMENTENMENTDEGKSNAEKEGIRIYFSDSSYSAPPVSTDKNGKSLGNFEPGYEINGSEAYPDEYWLWLCDRICNLDPLYRYIILDNGNGTYTIFEDKTAMTPRFKVLETIEEIPISDFWKTRDVVAERSIKPALSGYEDCFMEDTAKAAPGRALAATVDYAEGFWLDIKNTRALAKEVKDSLVEIDPDNSDIYAENYEKLDDELAALDDKYQFVVESSKNRLLFIGGPFVYGYMTEGYGIDYVSIYDYSSQEEQPTPTRLINFAAIMDEYDIKYIVKDKDSFMDGINGVKAESDHNINTLIIDTVEHVDDWENSSYLKIMEDNCTILKKSLY